MRYPVAIFLLLVMTILPGCWGRTELKDVSIVSGIGIDIGKNKGLELTAQTIKPGNQQGGTPNTVIVQSSTGVTIFEAIRDFIITAKRKLNFQHIDTIIIGKEIAKKGVTPVFDLFVRDHEPRFGMFVFLAENKAKDILQIQNKAYPIPTLAMKASVKEQKFLSKAPQVELHNFFQRLVEPFQDPYLPIIHEQKDDFQIHGTALFKGDRLVGKLSALETRGMLRALGEVKGGIQVIHFSSPSKEPVYISIEIKSSKSSISASIQNGQPIIKIEIHETGFIGDMSHGMVLNEKNMQKIKQLYADAIEKEVKHTVSKIQKDFKTNTFDFAGTIQREDKLYWKQHHSQWEEIYPTIKVEVKAKTDIPANGLKDSEGRS